MLDNLYLRLEVPLQWLDRKLLRDRAKQALQRLMGAYGRDATAADLERSLSAWTHNGDQIDFGRLDEPLQRRIIRHLARSPQDRDAMRPSSLRLPADPLATLANNRAAVQRHYSLPQYGDRLMGIYQRLLAEHIRPDRDPPQLDSGVILARFLAPEDLYLLRS